MSKITVPVLVVCASPYVSQTQDTPPLLKHRDNSCAGMEAVMMLYANRVLHSSEFARVNSDFGSSSPHVGWFHKLSFHPLSYLWFSTRGHFCAASEH